MQVIQNREDVVIRNCFICERVLYSAFDDTLKQQFDYPPYEAIVFTSYGNYGSTKLDGLEFEGKFVEISICDNCWESRKNRAIMMENQPLPKCMVKLEDIDI